MKTRFAVVVCAALLGAVALAWPSTASKEGGPVGCNDGDITWSPAAIWPPSHKMHDITITYADPDADSDTLGIKVLAITHDQFTEEGVEFVGSGNPHLIDTEGVGNEGTGTEEATTSVKVRGERSGRDISGRVYTITVECTDYLANQDPVVLTDPSEPDSDGNPNPDGKDTADVTVYIPHDMGAGNGV